MASSEGLLEEIQRNAEAMEKARVGFAKMADLAKSYYDALKRVGFQDEAALYLTGVMQGAWITVAAGKGGGQNATRNASRGPS